MLTTMKKPLWQKLMTNSKRKVKVVRKGKRTKVRKRRLENAIIVE